MNQPPLAAFHFTQEIESFDVGSLGGMLIPPRGGTVGGQRLLFIRRELKPFIFHPTPPGKPMEIVAPSASPEEATVNPTSLDHSSVTKYLFRKDHDVAGRPLARRKYEYGLTSPSA
ncbi:unnamed protein product [Diplocarpon coronariae]|uniref:Uncharacterized protein n=1 Tax=Diplocarpon coronariae TaxID=2795749 RepID=A0A218Z1B4_9HELO|nr:hypothetical protein JHW43_006909 [Diplocarpon mali]OWP01738.1 hypothetical protein B2J93_2330 [Marssonina coronariae]